MTVHLDWRLGPRGEHPPEEPAPKPRARRVRRPIDAQHLAIYAAGLLGAALIGFHLGRADGGRDVVARAIAAELAVEAHAVRTGDPDLFASTLDPEASLEWRHAAMVRFAAVRGQPWLARLVAVRPRADGKSLDVDVAVGPEAEGDGAATEARVYRSLSGRWVRAEGP